MDKTKLMKKLDELTALAAAHDKRLEMTQVLDCFADEAVTPEEMEDVYARLSPAWVRAAVVSPPARPPAFGLGVCRRLPCSFP